MDFAYQKLTIQHVREEVPGFKTIVLREEPGQPLAYQPGQYLTLVRQEQGRDIRRSYSLISVPGLNEPLAIGVKRIDNGLFSRYLVDQAKPGDVLTTTGAAGFFTLPADLADRRQIFFFAAGSGITPILALSKAVLHHYPELTATLVYSNHTYTQAIYRQELQALATAFPRKFHVEFLNSDAPDLSRARLHRDLLQVLLRQYAAAAPNQLLAYVCGPLNYMRMVEYGMREAGIPAPQIRRENFSVDKPVLQVQPPDEDPHRVFLKRRRGEREFTVRYPQTILQAGRAAGIDMPYSCEAGRCGNCAARCLSGRVWMSYNEVLTEKQLRQGLVLTCTGYPVGGDVVLED